jgi:predicted ATPase
VQLTLIGIDPGIVDSGAVAVTLDFEKRTVYITTKLWSYVTERSKTNKQKIIVSEKFLDELREFAQWLRRDTKGPVFVGIEGYRPRGFNIDQDARMTDLVQTINRNLPQSKVVDNTGIKKVVKQGLLDMMNLSRFKRGGNHSDLKSAARVALVLGIKNEGMNALLSDFVRDNLDGLSWSFVSTSTR